MCCHRIDYGDTIVGWPHKTASQRGRADFMGDISFTISSRKMEKVTSLSVWDLEKEAENRLNILNIRKY